MNSISESEGGEFCGNQRIREITPTARPPIRRKAVQDINNMGRYGVNNVNNRNHRSMISPNNSRGHDEVDNVMSKMERQVSPLRTRLEKLTRKAQRTNSYSQEEETSNTSYELSLSRSVPTILPSRLSYSDDSESEEEKNYSTNSTNSRLLHNSRQDYSNLSNKSNETLDRSQCTQKSEQSSNKLLYIFSLLIACVIAVYFSGYNYSPVITKHDKSTQTEDPKLKLQETMKYLQDKYNIDNDSILKLETGISDIFSKMNTGSFIFVYNSEANNFDAEQFINFTLDVASTAARYLRNDKSIQQTILESSQYLDMQEHEQLIARFRNDVDRNGVLIVKDVTEIPSNLAMAFHYYCDEYNPLAKGSAIFFTLNLASCTQSSEQKPTHDLIEKCLAKKWKTLPPENIRPLLTRVVEIIIDVARFF